MFNRLLKQLKQGRFDRMITADKVSSAKLRGGFYTPPALVTVCLDRVGQLTSGDNLRVLEPSAGDGAFIRGLDQHALRNAVQSITAVEIDEGEANAAQAELDKTSFSGAVVADSVLAWSQSSTERFDVAVGNPPFVRFQFVSPAEKQRASTTLSQFGLAPSSVSNLWLSVFMAALGKLVPGGVFSFILPAEALMGVSAQGVRSWLLKACTELGIDVFPPGSYPGVLQEVVVVSGRRLGSASQSEGILHVREHGLSGQESRMHKASANARTWTRYLLTAEQVAALEYALSLPRFRALGDVASFTVSTVTGANDFFCVSSADLARYGLQEWATPLLPRTRHAPGLHFSQREHDELAMSDNKSWLIHFAADKTDPRLIKSAAKYIETGQEQDVHTRYKCRIRDPWFRVPVVRRGSMLLSKRSHNYPRVILNGASVYTTDTIYRGVLLPGSELSSEAFVASFHNSMTLLTAEIEGRSFGGGVLELVPSEIARLRVPFEPSMAGELEGLDSLARTLSRPDDDALVRATDERLAAHIEGLDSDLMSILRSARTDLLTRRLNRN